MLDAIAVVNVVGVVHVGYVVGVIQGHPTTVFSQMLSVWSAFKVL